MVAAILNVKGRTRFWFFVRALCVASLGILNYSATHAQGFPAPVLQPPLLEQLSFAADQQPPDPSPQQSPIPLPQVPAPAGVAEPCIKPAPMVRMEDYEGPLRKVVGTFVGRFDRATATVHQPAHYKPGTILCTLPVKDKFILFLEDSIDPGTFLSAAFDASLDQAQNNDPSYGQGAQGYGKRFGANLAGQATSRFFLDFAYPSIFSEDPRYYRLGSGTFRTRLLHALAHSVWAHRDDGSLMFNFSEWLGTASTVLVSNTYHPDDRRGFAPAAARVGYAVGEDLGFDVLREFWPEISRKFRLPFRGEPDTVVVRPNPSSN